MTKAIFLDRDGVLNRKKDDYVKSISELEIFPFIVPSIKKINDIGFLTIILTNQSAINRGLMTHNDLKLIHNEIQNYLKKHSSFIDAFYYCPHRPDENCDCRKPKPGLIKLAARDFEINLNSSWMIGDSESDIETGKIVKCKTLKINENFNLSHAIDYIIKQEKYF